MSSSIRSSRCIRCLVFLALTSLITVVILFYKQLLSGFTLTYFNLYDGTIEVSVLEHWFAVLHGREAWNTTRYFYPTAGTLAYNDGYFLLGIAYSLPRWLGVNPYASAELAHVAMWLAGFMGMYAFLRAAFGIAVGWALLAAASFTLSSNFTAHSIHGQLSTVALVPVLGWLLARLARASLGARGWAALGWGVAAVALLGAWLLTALYMAWFTMFLALLLLPAWLLAADGAERRAAWQIVRVLGSARIGLLSAALTLALAPFLWLYVPKSAETGMHPVGAALAYLPRPTDILNVGPDNLLFGDLMARLHAIMPETFIAGGERLGGLSPPLLLAFLAACVWCWRATPFPGRGLLRALCLASITAWLLAQDYGWLQPWRFVYAFVPGAKAVRVVARIQLFLIVPVIVAVGVAFAHAARRLPWPATALAAAVLLLGQPAVRGPLFDVAKLRLQGAMSVPLAPAECAAFFTRAPQDRQGRSGSDHDELYNHNVDAMLIAELIGLPTINGFSTFTPPGWNFADPDRPDYLRRVWTYAQEHRLHGVCALSLASMTWDADPFRALREAAGAGVPIGVDMSVAAGQPGTALLGSGWSAPEVWGVWSEGPIATLVLGLGSRPAAPVTLTVRAHALPRRTSPTRVILVVVDGTVVATWTVGAEVAEYTAPLPPARQPGAAVVVRFHIQDPSSPSELGMAHDERRIGLALQSVVLLPLIDRTCDGAGHLPTLQAGLPSPNACTRPVTSEVR